MRYWYLILSTVLAFPVFAQKFNTSEPQQVHYIDKRSSVSSFQKIALSSGDVKGVERFISSTRPNFQNSNVSLRLVSDVKSVLGRHMLFAQYYKGLEVYNATIKVNLDADGNVTSVFDNSFSVDTKATPNTQDSSNVLFFVNQNEVVLATKVLIEQQGGGFLENIYSVSGNMLLYQFDHNCYYQDSLVTAKVFLPDPLTTAGVTYGGIYVDNGDQDASALNNERVQVSMRVEYDNDTFRLNNAYVEMHDFSFPNHAVYFSVGNPVMDLTRANFGFEYVNAYYHITQQQKHYRSLGFNNLVDYPIWVDARGAVEDNSFFSPGYAPPRLTFGLGGVDDAEDADVLIHEYAHATSFSAAPYTNTGVERKTLDEANADYLAASYSKSINTYNWENVYSWDGNNQFWPGRKVVSSKHYPEDLQNHIYEDADIWSSTLMQIWDETSREEADATVLASMYGYAANMTMEDAAALLLQADAVLFNGKNADVICTHLYNRGLLSECFVTHEDNSSIHLYNSPGFSGGEGAIVRFTDEVEMAEFVLYDVTGRQIWKRTKYGIRAQVVYAGTLPYGVYLLKVKTNAEEKVLKLIHDQN